MAITHPDNEIGAPRYLLDGPYGLGSAAPGLISADTIGEAEKRARSDAEYWDRFDTVNGQAEWLLRSGTDLLDGTYKPTDAGEWNLSGAMADGYPLERWSIGPRGGLNREAC